MSGKHLLPLTNADGAILAPCTLMLGSLEFKDTIELGWTIARSIGMRTTETVNMRQSRAPKPGKVRHRIMVNREERYCLRVDMHARTVTFEGPFVFRTLPGASFNLSDYKFDGVIHRTVDPKSTPKPARIGSFIRIMGTLGTWIGYVIDKKGDDFVVKEAKQTKTGNYRLTERGPWIIKPMLITGYDLRFRQISDGALGPVWKKVTRPLRKNPLTEIQLPDPAHPSAKELVEGMNIVEENNHNFAEICKKRSLRAVDADTTHIHVTTPPATIDLTEIQESEEPVPAPVSGPPELEDDPKKRMAEELNLMQAHAKRIRMTLDTLERASAELAAHWCLPVVVN